MAEHNHSFLPGQVWHYENRAGEDSSTLTILKLDQVNSNTIIHIRIDGIKLFNPAAPGGYSEAIEHLPFSEQVIAGSVTRLAGTVNELPPFEAGYNQWKQAWDSGRAGYWTIEIKEAIEAMDAVMRQQNDR